MQTTTWETILSNDDGGVFDTNVSRRSFTLFVCRDHSFPCAGYCAFGTLINESADVNGISELRRWGIDKGLEGPVDDGGDNSAVAAKNFNHFLGSSSGATLGWYNGRPEYAVNRPRYYLNKPVTNIFEPI